MDNRGFPTIGEIVLAVNEGLLTKEEGRAAIRDYFPALRRLDEAKALIDSTKAV